MLSKSTRAVSSALLRSCYPAIVRCYLTKPRFSCAGLLLGRLPSPNLVNPKPHLIERKAMLEKLLANLPTKSPVQFSGHVTGQGPEFFALACKRRLEGIISKRVN